MLIKKIKLRTFETENNLFFAPLAGFSGAEMRLICQESGAGLCFSEMVSAKGLKYSSEGTKDLLFYYPEERTKAVQIFGSEPDIMGWAASSEYLSDVKLIDINMGCPVPKVYKNGEGSALLGNMPLASKIIESVAKSGKDVSVKFRIGIDEDHIVTEDFAKMCEDSGASMITIHGRVRPAYYSGECNYEEIEKAKKAVSIPVIANGGVFTVEDGDRLIERTGADGIMIARGALENPFIFSDILGKKQDHVIKDVILWQIDMMEKRYGDRAAVMMRKAISLYLKGIRNSKKIKTEIFTIETVSELKRAVKQLEEI